MANCTREALREEKDRLRALVEINRTLASRLEVKCLLPLISECVTRLVPHDFAGVTLFEGDKESMKAYVLSSQRPRAIVESGRPVSLSQTLSAQVMKFRHYEIAWRKKNFIWKTRSAAN